MKTDLLPVGLGLILMLASVPCRADADASDGCPDTTAHVGFFNGVLNTATEAQWGMLALDEVTSVAVPPGNYELFYNESGKDRSGVTGWEDLAETFSQRANEENGVLSEHWETFWEIARGEQGSDSIVGSIGAIAPAISTLASSIHDDLVSNVVADLATLASSPPTEQDQATQQAQLDELIAKNRRIVLVGHSQGNLFLNAAYEYAAPRVGARGLAAVHIAPASVILEGPYTLADQDLIVNVLLRADGAVPDSNVNIPVFTKRRGPPDITGHRLIETYLNGTLATYPKVRADLDAALTLHGALCDGDGGPGSAPDASTSSEGGAPEAGASDAALADASDAAKPADGAGTLAVGGTGILTRGGSVYSFALPNGAATADTAKLVSGFTDKIRSVSAGSVSQCAITAGGAVECWGDNESYELGNGSSMMTSAAPVQATGLTSGVRSVSVGRALACAVTGAGDVDCWGNNVDAILGNASQIYSAVPEPVTGFSGPVAAVSASNSACALLESGGVECWGSNQAKLLGSGTNVSFSARPVPIAELSKVAAVSVAPTYACALTATGSVLCWGNGTSGVLGNGTLKASGAPVQVTGLTSGVSAISTGNTTACALASGEVYCWGVVSFDGMFSAVPVHVTGLAGGAVAVAAGIGNVCALLASGNIQCWTPGYDPVVVTLP